MLFLKNRIKKIKIPLDKSEIYDIIQTTSREQYKINKGAHSKFTIWLKFLMLVLKMIRFESLRFKCALLKQKTLTAILLNIHIGFVIVKKWCLEYGAVVKWLRQWHIVKMHVEKLANSKFTCNN